MWPACGESHGMSPDETRLPEISPGSPAAAWTVNFDFTVVLLCCTSSCLFRNLYGSTDSNGLLPYLQVTDNILFGETASQGSHPTLVKGMRSMMRRSPSLPADLGSCRADLPSLSEVSHQMNGSSFGLPAFLS